ncbi:HAD-IIB family hydrolase [Parasulfitobacter algicola]|uniref:HAD-IIB family hydrolase n=1 Tax=Parasulfitobacter algicola TaxID=2614809 RepID=A0ABX2ISF8_9RHOB|nr:HAD-IIB family hydrolase [Sulfitobacter algicola]NSX55842.1 HAD-IIB family hydrolase [Sulfitobacter algicola]
MSELIVFTDLDGTLLDHDSYSFAAALPALDRLRAANIPVILASSKTAAEITPLREELGLAACPAIVENGAGLMAAYSSNVEGSDYSNLRRKLDELPANLRRLFVGFGDMSTEQIAQDTGLPDKSAQDAANRQFSEPGIWHGSSAELDTFTNQLAARGISARRGGRYLTLSFGKTKADQMQSILGQFSTPTSIALGDAPNDIEMIMTADIGVIVHNPHHDALPDIDGERDGRIIRTKLSGPAGWNAALQQILSDHGID